MLVQPEEARLLGSDAHERFARLLGFDTEGNLIGTPCVLPEFHISTWTHLTAVRLAFEHGWLARQPYT
jgi:hypothetical protein